MKGKPKGMKGRTNATLNKEILPGKKQGGPGFLAKRQGSEEFRIQKGQTQAGTAKFAAGSASVASTASTTAKEASAAIRASADAEKYKALIQGGLDIKGDGGGSSEDKETNTTKKETETRHGEEYPIW